MMRTKRMHRSEWADVVDASRRAIEMASKALMHSVGFAPPWSHDISLFIAKQTDSLPLALQALVPFLRETMSGLSEDHTRAVYGDEFATPEELYGKEEATDALAKAERILQAIGEHGPLNHSQDENPSVGRGV